MKIKFEQPEFELNEKVFVIGGPDYYVKTTISAYQGLIFPDPKDAKKLVSVATHARTQSLIICDYFDEINNHPRLYIPLKYITKYEKEAKRWAQWHDVYMTEQEWLGAIGDREIEIGEIENIHEECELQSCCSSISDIRDILIRCKNKVGMIGWEIEDLQSVIDNSGHDIPEEHKLLDKIFAQIEIKWE